MAITKLIKGPGRKLAQWVAAFCTVLFAALFYGQYSEQNKVSAFNEAVTEKDFERAATIDIEHGSFAKAYQLHQSEEYQQARVLYAELSKSPDKTLAEAAKYNLANTYMQQALDVDIDKEADVAFPLFELAKVTYRELLADNEQHWGSKFNLERALEISPDSRTLPNVEIPGRQNPNRTVISIDPEDSLP